MAFKLRKDSTSDTPLLCCDVCGDPIYDIWSAKATSTPTVGQTVAVTVHHPACVPPPGSVTILLIDFLRLFSTQNRLGDLGSNGTTESVCVQYPTGKGFSV